MIIPCEVCSGTGKIDKVIFTKDGEVRKTGTQECEKCSGTGNIITEVEIL